MLNHADLGKNNVIVRSELSKTEIAEITKQSHILETFEIEDMTKETADILAEYYVRCQRLDQINKVSNISSARHEKQEQEIKNNNWEYWVLTSEDGKEYWLMGFTIHSFRVKFVFRDCKDGELLFGYFK